MSVSVFPPALIVCRAALAFNDRAVARLSELGEGTCIGDGTLLALVDTSEERLRELFSCLGDAGLDGRALHWLSPDGEPAEWLEVSKTQGKQVTVQMRGYCVTPAGRLLPPCMPI